VKTKSGNVIVNPYLGVRNRALDLMRGFLVEFGMTPSSRSRLQVQPAPSDGDDIWTALLSDSELPAIPVQTEGNA
jgi:phage terminase small subunit